MFDVIHTIRRNTQIHKQMGLEKKPLRLEVAKIDNPRFPHITRLFGPFLSKDHVFRSEGVDKHLFGDL